MRTAQPLGADADTNAPLDPPDLRAETQTDHIDISDKVSIILDTEKVRLIQNSEE